ncbi:MAG: hypothetical protein M0P12_00615 [Paludibacteraceae bacterium]|nr:hypothetical protein [Paludibacteraceae bacterium]MCK9615598.1 hypothetical protein [Candidatus Omnitrophota bacterium]
MKTYYDMASCYSITVDKGKIIKIGKKKLFKFDILLTYTDEEKMRYGSFGTAMFSGKSGKQCVEYGNTFLVDSSGGRQKVDILSGLAFCRESMPDLSGFTGLKIPVFWTNLTDFMPLFGYVCFQEKLTPIHSYFEQKSTPLDSERHKEIVEIADFLPGDDIGQLVQYLVHGGVAYNEIMESSLPNPFYGRTLSLLPFRDCKNKMIVLLTKEMFIEHVSGNYPDCPVLDFATYCPTTIRLTDKQKKIFGDFESLDFYCGVFPEKLSSFWGLMNKFSDSKVNYLFSYDMKYDIVAGTNMIGFKQS